MFSGIHLHLAAANASVKFFVCDTLSLEVGCRMSVLSCRWGTNDENYACKIFDSHEWTHLAVRFGIQIIMLWVSVSCDANHLFLFIFYFLFSNSISFACAFSLPFLWKAQWMLLFLLLSDCWFEFAQVKIRSKTFKNEKFIQINK